MTNGLNRQYEFVSKLFLIALAFLAIAFVLGYTWLILKNHSLTTSSLIVNTIKAYNDYPDESDSLKEEAFKNTSLFLARSGRSFLIVNEKDTPVIWSDLPVKNDPEASLAYFRGSGFDPVVLANGTHKRYLYFIPDDLNEKVRYFPFILIGSMVLTAFITWYLYIFMIRNEKQSLWIAMSKETAHQLGTPLTSLKGWNEHISRLSRDHEFLSEVDEGIKDDIERIAVIVDRFSKISAEHDFAMCEPCQIIERSADYIFKRVSADPERISIVKELQKVPGIYANRVLLEWTIENLLKNAIESLKPGTKGIISIKLFEEKDAVVIEIADNGMGISSNIRKNIFDTGFTTKKRGWGLGLSLAKKVIEQYHNGKLFLKETGQEGSVFRIELNKFI
jgi:two-component system, sporulation sensor kinase D